MPLGTKVGIGPFDIVLDGDPAPPNRAQLPPLQFLAHICCGQMAGLIKMALGTEVGFGPGDIVLDGHTASPIKRGTAPYPPTFQPMSIVAK